MSKSVLKEIHDKRAAYIAARGGYLGVREADDVCNDINREELTAMKAKYGQLYIGKFNYYGEERKRVSEGSQSVFIKLGDEPVKNFACDWAVPKPDAALQLLIQKWNTDSEQKLVDVEAITARIEALGGAVFVWF